MLEADLQSDEILACFEEALGERQPEMGTDAAAGREANAESAEAAPRLEAAAEQQREHSPLAPTAGRGVEPVLPENLYTRAYTKYIAKNKKIVTGRNS